MLAPSMMHRMNSYMPRMLSPTIIANEWNSASWMSLGVRCYRRYNPSEIWAEDHEISAMSFGGGRVIGLGYVRMSLCVINTSILI
jgi:hypothetical protein